MLGLILIYWLGKYFYKLAEEYNKSRWGFAVMGVVTYYTGTFFFGLLIATAMEIISPGYVDTFDDLVFGLMMVPFGILSAYLLYKYLEKSWKKKTADTMIDAMEQEKKPEHIQ